MFRWALRDSHFPALTVSDRWSTNGLLGSVPVNSARPSDGITPVKTPVDRVIAGRASKKAVWPPYWYTPQLSKAARNSLTVNPALAMSARRVPRAA